MKRLAWLMLLWSTVHPARAHDPSLAFVSLLIQAEQAEGRWEIPLADLEDSVGIDADGDRRLTWGELKARWEAVLEHAGARVRLSADGEPCGIGMRGDGLERHAGIPYAVIGMAVSCPTPARSLRIDYDFLFDVDAAHRALIEITGDGETATGVLSSRARSFALNGNPDTGMGTLGRFAAEGVWHIWHGYDHLVFLALLLVPAVLHRSRTAAEPALPTLWRVVHVVTAFTLAHSVTLAMAATGLVSIPGVLVEAVIAVSIIAAGIINLMPAAAPMGTFLAFGFGLVHGLGFANALGGLGGAVHLTSLVGFNAGVELGQLAVVALVLPFLCAVRRFAFLREPAYVALSVTCSAVGVFWLVERLS